MSYKITKTIHIARKPNWMLHLLCFLDSTYFQEYEERQTCRNLLNEIMRTIRETTVVRRNTRERIDASRIVRYTDDSIIISSAQGKPHLTFQIEETEN